MKSVKLALLAICMVFMGSAHSYRYDGGYYNHQYISYRGIFENSYIGYTYVPTILVKVIGAGLIIGGATYFTKAIIDKQHVDKKSWKAIFAGALMAVGSKLFHYCG